MLKFPFHSSTHYRKLTLNLLLLSSAFVSSGDECLTLALKGRCENQLKHRHTGTERVIGNGHMTVGTISTSGGNRLLEHAIGGLCEVHFLPLVVGVRDSNRTQRLRCVGRYSRSEKSPAQSLQPAYTNHLEGILFPFFFYRQLINSTVFRVFGVFGVYVMILCWTEIHNNHRKHNNWHKYTSVLNGSLLCFAHSCSQSSR